MTTVPPIWFLRHGQTEWNRDYRLQGQLDSPLTAQGLSDAERQATIMAPLLADIPTVLVSPLGRTRHTADIALGGRAYQTDPRLMEIHAGDWQGRYREDIMKEWPDLARQNPTALDVYEAAPNGEGLTGLEARVRDFMGDLKGPTVIVSHGLLGQVLRACIRGLPVREAGALSNRQGCVYHLADGFETVLEAPD